MNMQEIFDNAMAARRKKEMETSDQWTLIELIMSLKSADPKLPVIFDITPFHPRDLESWRGSYNELCIEYDPGKDALTVAEFLTKLEETVGATFTGYKGGEYVMGKLTPLWVANYGNSDGPSGNTTAVVGLTMEQDAVVINTQEMEY